MSLKGMLKCSVWMRSEGEKKSQSTKHHSAILVPPELPQQLKQISCSKGEPPLPEEQLPASEAWLILPSNPSSPLPPALLAHSVSWCISFVQVCRKLFFFPAGLFLCWITTQRSATVRKGEKVRGRSFHSSNKLLDQLRQTRATKEKCPEILLPDLDTT